MMILKPSKLACVCRWGVLIVAIAVYSCKASAQRIVVLADPNFVQTAEQLRARLVSQQVVSSTELVLLNVKDPFLPDSPEAQRLRVLNPQIVIAPQLGMFRVMARLGLQAKGIFFSHGPWASGADDAELNDIPMMGVRVTSFIDADAACLDWLRLAAPSIKRIGVIAYAESSHAHMAKLVAATKKDAIETVGFFVRSAQEAATLVKTSKAKKIDAWYFPHTPVVWQDPKPVLDAATNEGLPTAFEYAHYYAKSGGLIACASQFAMDARAGDAVRLLLADQGKTAPLEFRPGTLSVSINTDTARRLGLTVPASLLRRFDHRFSALTGASSR